MCSIKNTQIVYQNTLEIRNGPKIIKESMFAFIFVDDHSRVILKETWNDGDNDYINANFIKVKGDQGVTVSMNCFANIYIYNIYQFHEYALTLLAREILNRNYPPFLKWFFVTISISIFYNNYFIWWNVFANPIQ